MRVTYVSDAFMIVDKDNGTAIEPRGKGVQNQKWFDASDERVDVIYADLLVLEGVFMGTDGVLDREGYVKAVDEYLHTEVFLGLFKPRAV